MSDEDKEFEKELQNFYQELLKNQEPLGEDFTKVLIDNLWNLYDT